jgi:uncharacterized protein (UPF0333 family)
MPRFLYRSSITAEQIEASIKKHDIDNDGQIDENEVRHIIRQLLNKERESNDRLCLIFALVFLAVLLAVSNIGTAYLAVQMSKETTINIDGEMVSTSSSKTPISTVGRGISIVAEQPPFANEAGVNVIACLTDEELAAMWNSIFQGVSTTFSVSNEPYQTEMMYDITSNRAFYNETHLCVTTSDDTQLCVDFTDPICMDGPTRRYLAENHDADDIAYARRRLFQRQLEAVRGQESSVDLEEDVGGRKLTFWLNTGASGGNGIGITTPSP